ncbi:MAG TPA: hypothetical protein DEG17_22975 [Cyanobacteria bacterium UBA11149]|nr:hypothetical protein [Cyanobacteria bacterium UBA11367]HBE59352.1 hypothetical protein [Cyanobacteria bacterium UBA11366]HBK62037.1 hypothetical protein [Cyanobacteria bacterium UBA11166]HBR76140.1 hypothetical protein [Cyanobacteria bacterium UBA11159]HBS70531.1 hypothetical protein [Cyanobacteria bacterium UBA11153]HBW91647.1 hypothetical protein [Cyanobacteria bacterium UBA11149]HCA98029.1 hypothetical protein [Cyanobacteria bacterium UBA9226]
MMRWQQLRIVLLSLTTIGIFLVLVKVILSPNPPKKKPLNNAFFPSPEYTLAVGQIEGKGDSFN